MTMLLRKSVFVHVPRTGGMWVRSLCRRLNLVVLESRDDYWNHACHHDLPAALRALPSFAAVRHPLTWARSRWRHSLQINASAEGRFKGIHAEFDACVRPTLAETLREILASRPGLVGRTFAEATAGVTTLVRTESLPGAAVALLASLEGVSGEEAAAAVEFTPPCNASRTPGGGGGDVPGALAEEFVASEGEAMKLWEGAGG